MIANAMSNVGLSLPSSAASFHGTAKTVMSAYRTIVIRNAPHRIRNVRRRASSLASCPDRSEGLFIIAEFPPSRLARGQFLFEQLALVEVCVLAAEREKLFVRAALDYAPLF